MTTTRLTMAQALVKFLDNQYIEVDGVQSKFVAGVFTIFGHGNVLGLGQALEQDSGDLVVHQGRNEQGMAHAAIGFAKQHLRRKIYACTASVGPGAANMLTAAATATANRIPLLLLPGDVYASRQPDPVLQQIEQFHDLSISTNDAFRSVSKYWDRINRPEQLMTAAIHAMRVLTDPAQTGAVTLALPQDVQAMAADWPSAFFAERVLEPRTITPETAQLAAATAILKSARKPMIVCGGGVLYSPGGNEALRRFAEKHGVPIGETQAGKGALPWDHPCVSGAIGVTGTPAANELAAEADVVLAVGTRLQDFTTGSHTLYAQAKLVSINVNTFDAIKWGSQSVQADAALALDALSAALGEWRSDGAWHERSLILNQQWQRSIAKITTTARAVLPTYAEVIGAVQASAPDSAARDIGVCAAGTLPAEMHKLWRSSTPGGYHMEYGYSCMGYEVAGGLGVKMARPDHEVIVIVGDGSYLMLNNELATSVMLGQKIIVVVTDNFGYACITRLQKACGGAPFNNMFEDCAHGPHGIPKIDFAANARSLGAAAETVGSIAKLRDAMQRARASDKSYLISIVIDGPQCTPEGGSWWEVGIPEVSSRQTVVEARKQLDAAKKKQRL